MERPDTDNKQSLQYKFRKKRFRHIEALIEKYLLHQDKVTILDIGGRGKYWQMLDERFHPHVEITIVNFETDLEDYAWDFDVLKVDYRSGNGCDMPEFGDNSFDIVHSNSVLEHVGSLQNMASFARETKRVGKSYYVQTPYLWFPIEPHFGVPFLHWLPSPTRAMLVHKFKLGFGTKFENYDEALACADEIQIVDKTMMRKLFAGADHRRESFMLLTKSLIAVSA